MSNKLGQYFCNKCMRPTYKPGICRACEIKEVQVMKAGNFCDHCRTNATKELIYFNIKTKKRYCVDCRATLRMQLIDRGMSTEDATKIMIQDFKLINDPLQKKKIHKRKD